MSATKSNKQLIDDALALGQKLGVEVSTEGLNNPALVDLVDRLTAQLPSETASAGDAGAETPAAAAAAVTPAVAEAPAAPALVDGADEATLGGPPRSGSMPAQRYAYVVAEGKMVTTRRGMLGAFQQLSAQDLADGKAGEKALLGLVASGHVSKS